MALELTISPAGHVSLIILLWGKSWCDNLESYSDYASRLPRGRTYVRNGSAVDLQIAGQDQRAGPGGLRPSVPVI